MDADLVRPTASNYLRWLVGPFFRWWWAALTGAVSILSFFGTPESGLNLSRTAVLLLTLGFMSIVFLGVTSTAQGWKLYFRRNQPLRVLTVRKDKDFNSELLFVIAGYLDEKGGALLEVRRVFDNAELPFCVVRVIGTTEDGHAQATSIWTSPGHLRAFSRHEFEARDLRISSTLTFDRVREAFDGAN